MTAIRVGGILLAAGESRRMNGPNKLAIRIDGEALVRRTARTLLAAGIDPLVVVLGHQHELVSPLLAGLPVHCVVNADYRSGQQSSVRAGLLALRAMTADAVGEGCAHPLDAFLVSLSDLPLLQAAQVRDLIAAFARCGAARALVPDHADQRGNPVVFAGELLASLPQTPGGARGWLDAHPEAVMRITVSHAGFTTDLDTLADVAALSAAPGAPVVDLP